jgi:hypothetical protein
MRGVRHNMSWTEIGSAVKQVSLLPEKFQRIVAAARKRGHKWFASRYIRGDKGGAKRQIGYAIWIPKAEILGFSQTGIFVGETKEKTAFRFVRSHPLARTLKEAHHADVFTDWKRKGFRSHGYPNFAHWLEYRDIREREKKSVHNFNAWQGVMSRRWRDPMGHRAWPKYPGMVQKPAYYNPNRNVRTELVLWGFHPSYGKVPLKLEAYSGAAMKRRQREGWTCGVYAKGDAPTGLRLLAKKMKV